SEETSRCVVIGTNIDVTAREFKIAETSENVSNRLPCFPKYRRIKQLQILEGLHDLIGEDCLIPGLINIRLHLFLKHPAGFQKNCAFGFGENFCETKKIR